MKMLSGANRNQNVEVGRKLKRALLNDAVTARSIGDDLRLAPSEACRDRFSVYATPCVSTFLTIKIFLSGNRKACQTADFLRLDSELQARRAATALAL
jgi:hypothetical protein